MHAVVPPAALLPALPRRHHLLLFGRCSAVVRVVALDCCSCRHHKRSRRSRLLAAPNCGILPRIPTTLLSFLCRSTSGGVDEQQYSSIKKKHHQHPLCRDESSEPKDHPCEHVNSKLYPTPNNPLRGTGPPAAQKASISARSATDDQVFQAAQGSRTQSASCRAPASSADMKLNRCSQIPHTLAT